MDGWEIAIFVAAGYLAVMTLVRLMLNRHRQRLADFRAQYMAQQKHKKRNEPKNAAGD